MLGAMAWHQDTKWAAPLLAAWALSAMAAGTSPCLANHRDVCGTIGFRKPWGQAGVGVTVGTSILPQLPTAMSLQYFPTCMRRRRFCCMLKCWLCGKYDKQYKICQCAASLKFVCVDLELGDNCRAHFSHPSIGSLFFPHCNTYLLKECNRNQKLLPSHRLMAFTSRTSPWVGLVWHTVCHVGGHPAGGGVHFTHLLPSVLGMLWDIHTVVVYQPRICVFIWNKLGSLCCSVFMPKWHSSRFHCHAVCSNA